MKVMRSVLAAAVAMFILAGCVTQTTAPPAETAPKIEKLVMGFVPSQDAATIPEKVKPLNDYLTKELGIPVESFVGTTYIGVVEAMAAKKVDIAWFSTYAYVIATQEANAEILLKTSRRGSLSYRAVLNARKDANIPVCDRAKDPTCKATFDALKGKKIAFVDPASASGYLFPASFMRGLGVDIEKGKYFSDVTFAGQHPAVIQAVLKKDVDAGWTFDNQRDQLAPTIPNVMNDIVHLVFTDPIPNDTVSVRKDMPSDLKTKIAYALQKYVATDEGKKVLTGLYTVDGLVVGVDSDYDVIRNMAKNMGFDMKAAISPKK